jgi:DNA-binding MarR family transcriptional regulator
MKFGVNNEVPVMSARDPRYPVQQDVSLAPIARAMHALSQAHERQMWRFLEGTDLTPSQFDVLATLGDTAGMTCKELGAQSLITGGTLTPVLNRMEAKGLVARCKGVQDSRQTIVSLTPAGQALYEQVFLPFVDHMDTFTGQLAPEERTELVRLLTKLSGIMG